MAALVEELSDFQRILYAHNKYAVLLIFQAMDAAGKDSTIRAVMSGVNPAGCEVHSFQQPTPLELDHDFLWRTSLKLPSRGRIGIFNRSYYEEVLIVRVHPELLQHQQLPEINKGELWPERFDSIRTHEKHLALNGTIILKFWLNLSKKEQKKRFLSRIDEPQKNWKFREGDIEERSYWDGYMRAYEDVFRETSKPWAPWYAIPADDKAYMRMCVADIVVASLRRLGLTYPRLGPKQHQSFKEMRATLEHD